MKKLLLLSILCCLSMLATAQFKVLDNGHAHIGTESPVDAGLPITLQDNN